jgi:hypothetical protein
MGTSVDIVIGTGWLIVPIISDMITGAVSTLAIEFMAEVPVGNACNTWGVVGDVAIVTEPVVGIG